MRLKSTIYESTLSTAPRSPFPDGEGESVSASPLFYMRRCTKAGETRLSRFASLPLEGKVPEGRIGYWRYANHCLKSVPGSRKYAGNGCPRMTKIRGLRSK